MFFFYPNNFKNLQYDPSLLSIEILLKKKISVVTSVEIELLAHNNSRYSVTEVMLTPVRSHDYTETSRNIRHYTYNYEIDKCYFKI